MNSTPKVVPLEHPKFCPQVNSGAGEGPEVSFRAALLSKDTLTPPRVGKGDPTSGLSWLSSMIRKLATP